MIFQVFLYSVVFSILVYSRQASLAPAAMFEPDIVGSFGYEVVS